MLVSIQRRRKLQSHEGHDEEAEAVFPKYSHWPGLAPPLETPLRKMNTVRPVYHNNQQDTYAFHSIILETKLSSSCAVSSTCSIKPSSVVFLLEIRLSLPVRSSVYVV